MCSSIVRVVGWRSSRNENELFNPSAPSESVPGDDGGDSCGAVISSFTMRLDRLSMMQICERVWRILCDRDEFLARLRMSTKMKPMRRARSIVGTEQLWTSEYEARTLV